MFKYLNLKMNIDQLTRYRVQNPFINNQKLRRNYTFPIINYTCGSCCSRYRKQDTFATNTKQIFRVQTPLKNKENQNVQKTINKTNLSNFAASKWSDAPPATDLPNPPLKWTVTCQGTDVMTSVDHTLNCFVKIQA